MRQAFHVYAACLDARITFMMKYRDSPAPHPPEAGDQVFHATLALTGQTLTGVDHLGAAYGKPQGFSLQLNLTDQAHAQHIFATLAEGGVIRLPLQPTSWAAAYGCLADRFAIPWEINCGKFD